MKNKLSVLVVLASMTVTMLLLAAGCNDAPEQTESPKPKTVVVEKTIVVGRTVEAPEETTTEAPAATTPEPTETEEPEPEPKPEPEEATIPGLTAAEAVESFETNELECVEEEPSGLLFTCTSAGHPDYLLLYEGEIVGRGPQQIEGVEARLSSPSGSGDLQLTAQSFLGGIASDMVPEADSEEAFNFVYNDQDITGEKTTIIGDVELTLTGSDEVKSLRVGPAE